MSEHNPESVVVPMLAEHLTGLIIGSHQADQLLGPDFVSVSEVEKLFEVTYRADMLEKMQDCLPNESTFSWLKSNGMTLMPLPPFHFDLYTICAGDQATVLSPKIHQLFPGGDMSSDKLLLKSGGWLALRIRNTPRGIKSTRLVGLPPERMASVCEVVWGVMLHSRLRQSSIIAGEAIMTATPAADGGNVTVIANPGFGLSFGRVWDMNRYDYLGAIMF